MQTFSHTVGDSVLVQFSRDWDQLARELQHLELRMRTATASATNVAETHRIEVRVRTLLRLFQEQRALFELMFSGAWQERSEVTQLCDRMNEIVDAIARILRRGKGGPDVGRESLAEQVLELQKKMDLTQSQFKLSVGAREAAIQPYSQPMPADNPFLALAILFDVLRRLFLDSHIKH